MVIPNQSLNVFSGTEVVVPGEPEGNPTFPENESQVPNEPEPNVGDHATPEENEIPKESGVGSGDTTTDTNEIPEGQGSGGMMPNNGDPDNPDDPNNGIPENLDGPNNGVNPVNPDDPKAEIEALRQQLAQAQEALAKSTKTLQKRAAQDSQINNLRELVQKQQGEFDAQIQQYQTREKEQEKASYQASLDRQKLWEQERQKEQAEWVERQRAWEQEREKEQAEWVERKKAWEDKSRREIQERERVWNNELEKQKRQWEMKQDQERDANRKDLEKVKRELGDQVQQVLQAQQQQQQTAEDLMQENRRLITHVNQLADYNEELENEAQRIKARVPESKQKMGVQRSTPQGSPNGSIVQMKQSGATHAPSPIIEARPLENNSTRSSNSQIQKGHAPRGFLRIGVEARMKRNLLLRQQQCLMMI